jgi:hypothetical protein
MLKAMTSDSKSLPDAMAANPKWSPSGHQAHRHTQHGKVWRKKSSASRVLAVLASPPATKALDPDLYSRHSLRHAVYAIEGKPQNRRPYPCRGRAQPYVYQGSPIPYQPRLLLAGGPPGPPRSPNPLSRKPSNCGKESSAGGSCPLRTFSEHFQRIR